MSEAALERTVRFRASHRYHALGAPGGDADGPLTRSHAHDWAVRVTVRGPLDAHGFVVDLPALEARLAEVVGALDGSDLERAFTELRDGPLQPSTETLARLLFERLAPLVPAPARLERVRVEESPELAGSWPA